MRTVAAFLVCLSSAFAQPAEVSFEEAQRNALSQPLPAYPSLAKEAKVSGVVVYKLTIDSEGGVASAELASGHPLLIGGSAEVVKRWRYRPSVLPGGEPREVVTRVGIKFEATVGAVSVVEARTAQQEAIEGVEAEMSGSSEPYSVSAELLDEHQRRDKLPAYPPQAKAQKIEGTVRIRLRVDRTGKVAEATVVDGPQILRAAALDCVRQRIYSPFLRNGSAAAVVGDAYLTFTLDPEAQMQVFPGDEIDAILDKAMVTVRDLKIEQTEKYCFEAIHRARATGEERSATIRNALEILYELYSRAAKEQPEKEAALRERMLEVMSREEKPNGAWTAQALFKLGEYHLGSRRFAEAEGFFRRTIPLLEPCVDRPGTRICSMLLGDALGYAAIVLYAEDKLTESVPFFERAVARPEGAIHESTKANALTIYANVLYRLGRTSEATEVLKKAKDYQQNHPDAIRRTGSGQ